MRSFNFPPGPKQPFPKIPKVREYVEIKLTDGAVLTGYVFVEATSRIQDLLNSTTQFLPFVDEGETVRLLNKGAILQVRPVNV